MKNLNSIILILIIILMIMEVGYAQAIETEYQKSVLNFEGNDKISRFNLRYKNNKIKGISKDFENNYYLQTVALQLSKKSAQNRIGLGVTGYECDTEYKTNAEVCVSVMNSNLECTKNYEGTSYTNCIVSVTYQITTDYSGGSYLEVDVGCQVDIKYEERNSYISNTESNNKNESHTLFAYDSYINTMIFNFNFLYYKEVTKVRVSNVSCEIEDIYLL